jgi:hypothetical protein
VSDVDQRQVHQRPLRELTAEDLSHFAHSALLTWGTAEDFKHFLPRLFECMVSAERFDFVDREVLLRKLAYGKWNTWSQNEQAAVRRFMTAQWRAVLGSSVKEADAEDWLCAVGQAEDDLTAYLTNWAEQAAPTACEHLAALLVNEGNRLLAKGKLSNPFWQERREQMNQVIMWLASPIVRRRLEDSVFAQPPETVAEQFSLALSIQEALTVRFGGNKGANRGAGLAKDEHR